jgi:hypothetical protein
MGPRLFEIESMFVKQRLALGWIVGAIGRLQTPREAELVDIVALRCCDDVGAMRTTMDSPRGDGLPSVRERAARLLATCAVCAGGSQRVTSEVNKAHSSQQR